MNIAGAPPPFWTPERDQLLRSLAGKGESFRAIAGLLDCSDKTVGKRARALGVTSKHKIIQTEDWLPDRVAELTALIGYGNITFAEIGRRMGLSKNQCIGKASRLGIEGPRSSRATPADRLDALLNLFPPPGRCVYPEGDPGEAGFRFCGDRIAVDGVPYCDEHCRACYMPAGKREAVAA